MPAKKKDKPPQLTPQPTWELLLTKTQLIHLRDLMSILLPPDGARTVSQVLAAGEARVVAETQLWADIAQLCRQAKIPINKQAPDFVVMVTGAPALDVVRIAEGPDEQEQAGPDGDPSALLDALQDALAEEQAEPEKKPAPKKKATKGKKP